MTRDRDALIGAVIFVALLMIPAVLAEWFFGGWFWPVVALWFGALLVVVAFFRGAGSR